MEPALEKKINIGVAGCGGMGREHIRSLLKGNDFTVAALCDPDGECLSDAVRLLQENNAPMPAVFREYGEMLASRSCEAVLLAVPIAYNARCAWEALEAGHHVFSEKPFALTLPEAARVAAAREQSGKVYQIGFQLRSSPLVHSLLEVLRRGDIGVVHAIVYTYLRKPDHSHRSWAFTGDAGNVLFDSVSHSFDLINHFAGDHMESVHAFCGKVSTTVRDNPDIGVVSVRYANGVHASLVFGEFCGAPYPVHWYIAGEKGKVLVNPHGSGRYTVYNEAGDERTTVMNPALPPPGDLGMEHRAFRAAVLEGKVPPAGVDDGLESLFLSIGATRSFMENRVISRPELLGEFTR